MSSEKSRGSSRSEFLKQAAGATVVVAGAGVGAGAIAPRAAAADAIVPRAGAAGRGSAASYYSLELEGINVGALASAHGGVSRYQVLLDGVSSEDHVQPKHLGEPEYDDFTIRIGCGMGSGMYDWIKDTFDKGYITKSGAIVVSDLNRKEVLRRAFTNARITEVTIPALDGASKEAGYLEVTFSPGSAADVQGSGNTVQAALHKRFSRSNFRITIDGLETSRVASIDSFTWKSSIADDGSLVLDAGDLGVTFSPLSLPSWQSWYATATDDERNGVLAVGGIAGGAVLNLGLFNLGLYALDPLGAGISGADSVRRVTAEMYCERGHWDIAVGNKV